VCVSMSGPLKVIFTICLGFGSGRGQLGTTAWTARIPIMIVEDHTQPHNKEGVYWRINKMSRLLPSRCECRVQEARIERE